MIDESLVSLFRTVAGVNLRITPSTELVLVYTQLPRLIYTLVPGGDRRYSDDGAAGLVQGIYQLDAFAEYESDARDIMKKLMARNIIDVPPGLDGYRGAVLGVRIERIYFPNHESFSQGEKIEGKGRAVARVMNTMTVEYRE